MWINSQADPNEAGLQEMEALRVHADSQCPAAVSNAQRLEIPSSGVLEPSDSSLFSTHCGALPINR